MVLVIGWAAKGNAPPSNIENQLNGDLGVDPTLDEQENSEASCDISEFRKEWANREEVPAKQIEHLKLLRNYAFTAYRLMETLAEEVGKDGFINTGSVIAFESPSTATCRGFVAEDRTGETIYVSFRGSTPKAKSENMYFLGHSLGGAIANLAAFDYPLVSKYKGVLKPHLVTFGSPPVGNMEFVKQYNKQLIPSTLVTSGFNLVPNVHLLGTYLHAKIEIYILPGGKHTIQCLYNDEAFANDPACSPDLSLMNCSIADHSNYWGLKEYTPTPGMSKSSDPRLRGKLVKWPTNAQLMELRSIGDEEELNDNTLKSVLSDNEGASDDEYYDALDYSDLPESGFSDIGIPSMTYPDPNGRSDRPLLV
ncbi:hypothetical protein H4R33_004250 [Dimargaris cristalligena]|nr:hypothetical protein H4R33_004250 [Dimargaris cristalligena]